MAEPERRQHPRINPHGIKAKIFVESRYESANLEGEVIDISHTGVKIKLDDVPSVSMDGKIRIEFLLPESDIPFSISGVIKHQFNDPTQLGLHYVDCPVVEALDRFMFECIKLASH